MFFSVAGYHAVVCDAFISCLSYKHFRRFAPLKKIRMQSCQHDIANSIFALGFKLLEN